MTMTPVDQPSHTIEQKSFSSRTFWVVVRFNGTHGVKVQVSPDFESSDEAAIFLNRCEENQLALNV
jgi:hypothetical protein